jgi:ABC-type multidrug transport system fused ATPase/permease subunit
VDGGGDDLSVFDIVPELPAETTGEKDPYFMSMVEFSAVAKNFGATQVLHDINLKIEAGEVVVIIGPRLGKIDPVALH